MSKLDSNPAEILDNPPGLRAYLEAHYGRPEAADLSPWERF